LSDQQKFAVLGQGLGGGAIDFRPRALRAVHEAQALAEEDLEAGLRAAKGLEDEHPHAPAVSLLHARLALRAGQETRAAESASRALQRATRGGMNAIAVDTLESLPESLRPKLMLSRAGWTQLARALRAANRDELAAWALERHEQVDPAQEARIKIEAAQAAGRALRARSEEHGDGALGRNGK
jgi:hypothetical protein